MIAGYCWPQSATAGDTVEVFCHTDSARFDARISRSGLREDLVQEESNIAGLAQELAPNLAEEGCDWTPSFAIRVQPEWVSGLYLVRLTNAEGEEGEAFFVVRPDKRADALFVLATSTWAAYNAWGGPSFYTGTHTSSMRRPLPKGMLCQTEPDRFRVGRFLERTEETNRLISELGYEAWSNCAGWGNWEVLFARWAESAGYELGYATSQDLDRDPAILDGYPAYVSVGHDEYWSTGMRDAVEAYVDGGGNAAFFSGNTAFWHARFEADRSRVVCHKTNFRDDPVFPGDAAASVPELSTMWSDPLVGRPENEMTGVSFTRGGYAGMPNSPAGTGGYAVHRPQHWVFAGLDLEVGDQVGADGKVVAYECDGCDMEMRDGVPQPTGVDGTALDFEILGTAPARLWETHQLPGVLRDDFVGELNWVADRIGGEDTPDNRARFADGHAVLGTHRRGDGQVFTTGCTDWAYGLDCEDVATVTRNVLQRFVHGK